MEFPDASGKKANLLVTRDGSYCEMLDRFVQSEVEDYPDTSFMRGLMTCLGIAKGKKFSPAPRQKEMLDYAAKPRGRGQSCLVCLMAPFQL